MNTPWVPIAEKYLGLKEVPGPKSNPTILEWASRLQLWVKKLYTNDEIPWCGLFMAGVFRELDPKAVVPSNPLSAVAWALWGQPLKNAVFGAILVFKRPGGFHVGIYKGEDATCYYVLGGNQGDSVSVVRIQKNRLFAIRYPAGYEPAGSPVYVKNPSVKISDQEA